MSTQLPFKIPRRIIIYAFSLSYIKSILSYISGEMGYLLISSIIFFVGGCFSLFIAEPRLSRRASIALVTTGLCLYAPAPFLVLQGYLRLNPQFLRDLAIVVIAALALASISLIYGLIRYKKSLVTSAL
jgi:hypothetical protein